MRYETCELETKLGKITGRKDGDVMLFDGIRYATDNGRFRKASPAKAWDGVLDATSPARAFPQSVRPLKVKIDGSNYKIIQDEDAFELNIRTTGTATQKPVVFWIHGGGYSTGACSLPQYDGREISRAGDVVFVGVNYRLGALGNILLPGIADENLAVRDLILALRWVVENISDYGGDPGNITIMGQSAGAWYAVCMAACGQVDGMFSKLLLMSCPGTGPLTRENASILVGKLMKHLEISNPHDLVDMPIEHILDAQFLAEREMHHFGLAFVPIVGDRSGADPETPYLEEDFIGQAIENCGGNVAMFDGITTDETTFFMHGLHDVINNMNAAELDHVMSEFVEGDPDETISEYERVHATKVPDDPYWKVIRLSTDMLFTDPSDKILQGFDESFGYEMAYRSANPIYGSGHCMELPMVFGDFGPWAKIPMFRDNDPAQIEAMTPVVQGAMIDFIKTGNPGGNSDSAWKCYKVSQKRVVFA